MEGQPKLMRLKLGMILHYYCGAMELKTLGLSSKYNKQNCEEALEKALRKHPLATIRFPSKDDQQVFARKVEDNNRVMSIFKMPCTSQYEVQ